MTTFQQESSQEELDALFTPAEQDIIERDHRTCDCELTYVHRKRHAALGTAIEIRLCCLAKKVEELSGVPRGTFFSSLDFTPSWEWDCDKPMTTEHQQPDGSIVTKMHKPGPPPQWLLERMQRKGIEVKNLPS
jgi:hypothetical protein